MPTACSMSFEPAFVALDGKENSRRFVVLHLPAAKAPPRGLVVHAPAFAEEMNKARRMVALQARALADDGFAVLLVDPMGCGDSPGDFGDASWDVWVGDITLAMGWLRREFARRWPEEPEPARIFWGLRAGALLASAAAERTLGPSSLVLWQPVCDGRLMLRQFLRLLSAGELVSGNAKEAQAAARKAIASGQTQVVAGYCLAPALALGLEAATLDPGPAPAMLHAFELSTQAGMSVSPTLQSALERWQQSGWQTRTAVVDGPSFWQTTEVEDAPALLDATTAAFRSACATHEATGAATSNSSHQHAVVS